MMYIDITTFIQFDEETLLRMGCATADSSTELLAYLNAACDGDYDNMQSLLDEMSNLVDDIKMQLTHDCDDAKQREMLERRGILVHMTRCTIMFWLHDIVQKRVDAILK